MFFVVLALMVSRLLNQWKYDGHLSVILSREQSAGDTERLHYLVDYNSE